MAKSCYKDLEEARAKREAKEKEKVTAVKVKRGRKRKNPILEEVEAGPSASKDEVVRVSDVEPMEAVQGVSWSIPVAKMY